VVVKAEFLERKANATPRTETGSRFLDYPTLRVCNAFYANLLNTWRALYIFIDFIAFPDIKTKPKGSKRYNYAALGKRDMFPIGNVHNMFLTGVAFGGYRRSTKEIEWLNEWMFELLNVYQTLNMAAVVKAPLFKLTI
jgi:hypothetical protein